MRADAKGGTMRKLVSLATLALAVLAAGVSLAKSKEFTDSFMIETCEFASEGSNPYFILTPGYQLSFATDPARRRKGPHTALTITVLRETLDVAGVTTRVVEERESADGKLAEISRNYFAICQRTGSVFYFGEDVDIYDDSGTTVVSHEGAWRAGVDGARPGVVMPGIALVGARYFQEVAPGVAEDRAEITTLNAVVETPAGTFPGCLATKETSTLERGKSFRRTRPGSGSSGTMRSC
jgi:hypothetical protein